MNIMQIVSVEGNISLELKEIKEMQKNQDSILSISTNTCGEIRTVICC